MSGVRLTKETSYVVRRRTQQSRRLRGVPAFPEVLVRPRSLTGYESDTRRSSRRLLVKQSRCSGVGSRRRRRWRRRRLAQKDALAERKPRAGAERPGSTETAVAAVDS